MSLIQWIDLATMTDGRGALVAVEGGQSVPFDIKRVYYLHSLGQGVVRGLHAHRALQQVMICVAGSCRVILDDGRTREEVVLDTPNRGLLVGRMLWREMHDFSPDCVMLVLASAHYDETDYIRDYEQFLLTQSGGQGPNASL